MHPPKENYWGDFLGVVGVVGAIVAAIGIGACVIASEGACAIPIGAAATEGAMFGGAGAIVEGGLAAIVEGIDAIAAIGGTATAVASEVARDDGSAGGARAVNRLALPAGNRVPYQDPPIHSFITGEDMIFYRVYSGDRTVGSFLTATRPASADYAVSGLALPPENRADFIQEVLVPKGTVLQSSFVKKAFGQDGGYLQFELLNRIPAKNFGPGVRFR